MHLRIPEAFPCSPGWKPLIDDMKLGVKIFTSGFDDEIPRDRVEKHRDLVIDSNASFHGCFLFRCWLNSPCCGHYPVEKTFYIVVFLWGPLSERFVTTFRMKTDLCEELGDPSHQ